MTDLYVYILLDWLGYSIITGMKTIKVLDGGFPKWVYEKSVEAGETLLTSKGDFQPKDPDPAIFSDKKTLIKILEDNEDIQILDVRSR